MCAMVLLQRTRDGPKGKGATAPSTAAAAPTERAAARRVQSSRIRTRESRHTHPDILCYVMLDSHSLSLTHSSARSRELRGAKLWDRERARRHIKNESSIHPPRHNFDNTHKTSTLQSPPEHTWNSERCMHPILGRGEQERRKPDCCLSYLSDYGIFLPTIWSSHCRRAGCERRSRCSERGCWMYLVLRRRAVKTAATRNQRL